MSSEPFDAKSVVVGLLVTCTVIGYFDASRAEDAGVVVTWIWMGIGFSVTYLLYRLRKCEEKAPPFRAGMNPTRPFTNHRRWQGWIFHAHPNH